jgi:hypothetical protein
LYVDDLLADVDKQEAENLRTKLVEWFGMVLFEESSILSYLGMKIDVMDEGTTIDMIFYTKQLLEGVNMPERQSSGTKSTIIAQEDSEKLSEQEHMIFHLRVEKLLFLDKRARPDILTFASSVYMYRGLLSKATVN